MQLRITTDYAVRFVVYLAIEGKDRLVSASEIAENLKVSSNYLMQIAFKLKESGMLATVRGVKGGFLLKRDPKKITLFDIIEIMDDDMKIDAQILDKSYISSKVADFNPVRQRYLSLQSKIHEELKKTYVSDLM